MPALDEKQIQEKLYGHYRKGTMPVDSKTPEVELTPSLPEKNKPSGILIENIKKSVEKAPDVLTQFANRIPWPIVGIVFGSLLVSALLFQGILFFGDMIKKQNSLSPKHQVQNIEVVEVVRAVPSSIPETRTKIAKTSVETVPSKLSETKPALTPASAVKQKYFGVQVYTSEREQDAKIVASELIQLGFQSFYRKKETAQEKTYYEVFLSRETTYDSARATLGEFRKTKLYQKFSDAFICSI
jgi:hypothetical protein